MVKNDIFKKLFIFEMANNHMGSLEHGLKIIREFHEVSKKFDFKFGFKLQYRDLDTFIHPDFKNRMDIKYIKRFSETRLKESELKILKDEIKKHGFIAICTPFDENSVDLIEKHDFDIIKIGSCSFTDWPLLERIAKTEKHVIASTAGASLEEIDRVVSFFEHRKKDFCLMHCVGEYPTRNKVLELNQIDFLRERYPDIAIGYSTHEEPGNLDAIKIAVSKRAAVFERHVGIKTDKYALNTYSSTQEQINNWLLSAQDAYAMCGVSDIRRDCSEKEKADLCGLKRGVFAKRNIKKGEKLDMANTFFAIPNVKNQILANDFSKYMEYCANKEITLNKPILFNEVVMKNLREKFLQIIQRVRQILIDSKITLPNKIEFELSHHYGIEKFDEYGAVIISCINREYCKKIIIMLPGQKHPVHYHEKKEETFHVLYGDITITLEDVEKEYKPGELIIVERGVKHSFRSKNGVVFEEVSTTHYKNDSFYEDAQITQNKNRKTEMTFWSDWLVKPIA
ncbi:N-acetylneuraminate synthase family protein [archaeon]|nr:N-acetylneuraminate synthase family protein [Nanoarchaeota archaeon]MCG2723805.1 N-acetylneuraminate synthase family protein [archaeon]